MKTVLQIITLALSLLSVSVAYSHDIWLLPERFNLSKGDTLTVRQLAGTELDTALELPFLTGMTPRFELITPNGSVDLLTELRDARTSKDPSC